jgi:hypothetical protein
MPRQGTVLGRGVLAGDRQRVRLPGIRVIALIAIIAAAVANVFAANISFNSNSTLGTGTAVVAACDPNGFSVKPVTAWVATDTAFKVVSVVVGSGLAATTSQVIDTSCAGKTIDGVILSNGTSIGRVSAVSIASSNVTGATPLTVALSSGVLSSLVDQIIFEVRD